MLYYMLLDKEKEFLEIKEVANIDKLATEIKSSWVDINYFLNGDDKMVERLPCGFIVPFIKRNGKVYMIAYNKEILEYKNYSYMSKKVLDEVSYMIKNGKLKNRTGRDWKKEDKGDKVTAWEGLIKWQEK